MSRSAVRKQSLVPRIKIWFESGGRYAFGLGICEMLQAVERAGSIKQAAGHLGKSYRHVWGRIKEAEAALGQPLVETHIGGKGTQRSSVTAAARQLITSFSRLRRRMLALVETEFLRHL